MHAEELLIAFLELERAVCIPPIERTMLTIIAAMAASITLCVPDEKLTAFLELESAIRER